MLLLPLLSPLIGAFLYLFTLRFPFLGFSLLGFSATGLVAFLINPTLGLLGIYATNRTEANKFYYWLNGFVALTALWHILGSLVISLFSS